MIIRRRYSHYAIAGEATWQRLPAIRAVNMLRAGMWLAPQEAGVMLRSLTCPGLHVVTENIVPSGPQITKSHTSGKKIREESRVFYGHLRKFVVFLWVNLHKLATAA